MAKAFKCPTCAASLEYDGGKYQKCTFCGTTVILSPDSVSQTDSGKETGAVPEPGRHTPSDEVLISIRNLQVFFKGSGGGLFSGKGHGVVRAVDDVSLDIRRGETLGLVGESGCGKSTLGKAILRLTDPTGGRVMYNGKDLAHLSGGAMRDQRRHLQMIFQDPYASLNPRMTVGSIIGEPIRTFGLFKGESAEKRVQDLMETVGLSRRFIKRYPHEFSGGQRQRIGIARALAVDPEFIVADEPISALDVSIQAQIMNLMEQLQAEKNLTYLFISHDLRAVRHLSDRVAVMYLGKIVELADGAEIYKQSLHPYSKALISAVPVPDPEIEAKRERIILKGDVPSPINPPPGCHFHTRCQYAIAECKTKIPPLVEIRPRHYVACLRVTPEKPDIDD
ncbi:MAG: ATP-binding cassette domain-containing protein [Acidobacteria bacterium]|nr:ATP-binding cassette domain-containing protein [Acidobacteriota bacterium]MBK8147707.1 ATP-binding cassette domain-containing protein [Acidobacteriota bacterium]